MPPKPNPKDQAYKDLVQSLYKQFNTTKAIIIDLPTANLAAQQGAHWNRAAYSAAAKKYKQLCKDKGLVSRLRFTKQVRIHHVWFCADSPLEKATKQENAKTRGKEKKGANLKLAKTKRYYRPMDGQNAVSSLKHGVDGLRDAGVFVDDSDKYVKWGEFIKLSKAEENFGKCFIILFFEELEP